VAPGAGITCQNLDMNTDAVAFFQKTATGTQGTTGGMDWFTTADGILVVTRSNLLCAIWTVPKPAAPNPAVLSALAQRLSSWS
jgi:hypothetical protein